MNIVLWILQVLLAVLFLWHGWLFLSPPPELAKIMNAEFSPWFRMFLGVAEWLGAAGLILPGVTRLLPWLISWAAMGLMIVVGSATILHLTRGETGSAITTAVLFGLCALVAYMRWKRRPIVVRQKLPVLGKTLGQG
jgi:uncharacterized membrane protein YphA (DoxX/SURF4 family)